MGKQYFPVVQVMRGIFTLLVAVYHLVRHHDTSGALLEADHVFMKISEPFSLLVYAFFMFSAFVVPMGISGIDYRLEKFPAFILRRFIRIQLPYLASIILIIALDALWKIRQGEAPEIDPGRLITNFLYIAPLTGYTWYNIIYWTLCLEFQCYLVIGLLMPFFENADRRKIILLLGAWSFCPIIFKEHLFFFKYTPVFNMGLILFLFYRGRIKSIESLALILLSASMIAWQMRPEVLVILLISMGAIHFYRSKQMFFDFIGKPSYSMYLLHGLSGGLYLILRFRAGLGNLPWFFHLIAAILISIIASMIFYWFVEKPAEKIAKRIRLNS